MAYTNEDSDIQHDLGTKETTTETAIRAVGEVTKDEFKIDRGDNTSMRMTNAHGETGVQEILNAVEIGEDLSDDQKEQVRSLVREYADVFALSLSEVLYVDWYKHKLNFEPNSTSRHELINDRLQKDKKNGSTKSSMTWRNCMSSRRYRASSSRT
jgi:hypothetical protein